MWRVSLVMYVIRYLWIVLVLLYKYKDNKIYKIIQMIQQKITASHKSYRKPKHMFFSKTTFVFNILWIGKNI